MHAGYAPNSLPLAGETEFFSAYTDPPQPPEAVACGWSEASGEDFDEFGTWWDNTLVSFGGEAFKSLGDFYFSGPFAFASTNSSGVVGSVNSAFQLLEGSPVRGQIGASYGIYDFKGRETVSRNEPEQQLFVTLGVSKRSDVLHDDRLSWGIVWDQLAAFNWGALSRDETLGQVRSLVGWAVGPRDEIGFWGAYGVLETSFHLRAANQSNLFWRHNYDFGGQTMLWFGGNTVADASWLVGSFGEAPLSNALALYGNFTFSIPGASASPWGSVEELWAFGAGLTYYFGAKSVRPSVSGRQGLPLLPVANNGTFLPTF
ncbi:MAG: DUF6666 family protein [Pirellulales bacterium]